jgi:hypothetical protein
MGGHGSTTTKKSDSNRTHNTRRWFEILKVDGGNSTPICNMTQQLVELANYFGLARVPAPPAAGDNWALAGLAETGKIRLYSSSRTTAAHHCILIAARVLVVHPAHAWRQSGWRPQEGCTTRGQKGGEACCSPVFLLRYAAQGIDLFSGYPVNPTDPTNWTSWAPRRGEKV